jgi:iron(III) transport system ATP-binding protein
MSALTVEDLSKRYPGAAGTAVDGVSFSAEEKQILALVGPSGCGKTTLLRLIAGLERPDAGAIRLNGGIVAGDHTFTPPERRGVGMVFQDHALFPHLTIKENVAFGLRGRPRETVRAGVAEMLALVELEGLANRYPHALSGGERQRAALARALAPRPALVLMDEPFSSLDADLRLQMRQQVRELLKARQATALFVTHDQEEALFMGDQLGVLRQGRLEQIGAPEEIFHAAATRFVAEFMGGSDFLRGVAGAGGVCTEIGWLAQPVSLPAGTAVEVALRADDVDFHPQPGGNAVITRRSFRGAFNLYELRLDSGQVLHALKAHTEILPAGLRVQGRIAAGHALGVFQLGN